MMAPHIDILEQPERLRGCFLGSLALHALVFASIVGFTWAKARAPRFSFGNPNGGGFGSVAVNVVPRIPLPTDSGPVNPVANDTQSRAPEPPPKPKAQPRAKAPDLDSIPLPSRSAPRRTAEASTKHGSNRQSSRPDTDNAVVYCVIKCPLPSIPHQGQCGSAGMIRRMWCHRIVVIEQGLWRSVRTGSAPWAETFGYGSGSEEGERRRGGKPSALGRQE